MVETRRIVILLIVLLHAFPLAAHVRQVFVDGQPDLDSLQYRLEKALGQHADTVDIIFSPGPFRFREGQLSLKETACPDVTLRLEGNGALFVPVPATQTQAPYDACWLDLDQKSLVDLRSKVRQAGFWPVPVPFRKGLYALRCREDDLDETAAEGMQIILSQWFIGAVYPVVKIAHGFIFFRKEPQYGTRMWSELRYGRCLPRYILCPKESRPDLHHCGASNFLSMEHCRFRSFRMEGFSFLGSSLGAPLMLFEGMQADSVVLEGCRFEGIRTDAVRVIGTDHFRFRNNLCMKGYLSFVRVSKLCEDARIEGNTFLDNGLAMTNAAVVDIQGSDFRVADNYFEDFSYAAVRTGTHFTDPDGLVSSGVVERNEFCMTPSFREPPMRSLIDGGAIYIATQNRSLTIQDNYIHDIAGPHGNRGIFGDDGMVNVTVCNNRIFRIRNSYCIDMRKDLEVGRRSNTAITRVNVGNRIYGNQYDGRVRWFVRKDDPASCIRDNVKVK